MRFLRLLLSPAAVLARVSVVCLLCSVALAGCEENLDPATPDGALHRLRDAVAKKDAPAMLDSCSTQTRALLKDLHGVLSAQGQTINETYPEKDRVAARASYPPGVLEAKSPESLFSALLELGLKELDTSPGLAYGMTAQGKPSIDSEHASVTSQAGETYEFVLEGGVWRVSTFEREISAAISHARMHQQTMDENLKVIAELKRLEQLRAEKAAAAPPSAPRSAPAP